MPDDTIRHLIDVADLEAPIAVQITDPLMVLGRLNEELSVWAANDDRVVIEIVDAGDCINAHLTIAQAEKHIEHVRLQIAAARRLMGRQYLQVVK